MLNPFESVSKFGKDLETVFGEDILLDAISHPYQLFKAWHQPKKVKNPLLALQNERSEQCDESGKPKPGTPLAQMSMEEIKAENEAALELGAFWNGGKDATSAELLANALRDMEAFNRIRAAKGMDEDVVCDDGSDVESGTEAEAEAGVIGTIVDAITTAVSELVAMGGFVGEPLGDDILNDESSNGESNITTDDIYALVAVFCAADVLEIPDYDDDDKFDSDETVDEAVETESEESTEGTAEEESADVSADDIVLDDVEAEVHDDVVVDTERGIDLDDFIDVIADADDDMDSLSDDEEVDEEAVAAIDKALGD